MKNNYYFQVNPTETSQMLTTFLAYGQPVPHFYMGYWCIPNLDDLEWKDLKNLLSMKGIELITEKKIELKGLDELVK